MSLILSGHIGRCRAGMTVCHAAPKPALRNYSLIHYGVFYPLFYPLSTPKRAVFYTISAAHRASKYLYSGISVRKPSMISCASSCENIRSSGAASCCKLIDFLLYHAASRGEGAVFFLAYSEPESVNCACLLNLLTSFYSTSG